MPEDVSRVIDKIRKLLAMAADSSSPHEAAIAAGQARKLMDKWQVSLHDIPEISKFSTGATGKARRFTPMWEQQLALSIGEYNDCVVSWLRTSPVGGSQICFKGYTPDVRVCEMVYDYLVSCAILECKKAMPSKRYNARLGTIFKGSFVTQIRARFEEMIGERTKMLESAGPGNALILVKKETVELNFGATKTKKVAIRNSVLADEKMAEELGSVAGKAAALFLGLDVSQAKLNNGGGHGNR